MPLSKIRGKDFEVHSGVSLGRPSQNLVDIVCISPKNNNRAVKIKYPKYNSLTKADLCTKNQTNSTDNKAKKETHY